MEAIEPLPIAAPPDVADALASIGRTEDAVFSPDGRRVAVAGFAADELFVLEVAVTPDAIAPDASGEAPIVTVSGFTAVRCAAFAEPHGVAFVDDHVLVASRKGGVTFVPQPPHAVGVAHTRVEPTLSLDVQTPFQVKWPGSARADRLAPGLFEVVVCNNYVHRITRHLVDVQRARSLQDDLLLSGGVLDIPDGIALSKDGRWMALSNHHTHVVFVYDRTAITDLQTEPVATLHGMRHPHGLTFTHDDSALLVADGGTPFITVFERGRSWRGDRTPHAVVRVMSDEMFAINNRNPGEGGSKGVDLHPSGAVSVISGEARPVAFFDTKPLVGGPPRLPHTVPQPVSATTRRALLAERSASAKLGRQLVRRDAQVAELRRQLRERDEKIQLLEMWIGALREQTATTPSE